MTGEEIKTIAELHTEDLPIEDSQAIAFINECILMDLGKDAGVIESETIEAQKDTWTSFDKSFLTIFEIEKKGLKNPYYGSKFRGSFDGIFDIKEKQIRFPEEGTYTITGYIVPEPYTDLSEEPAIHELLHYPIALYVASRATFWDDEENPSSELKMRDYRLYKQNALMQIKKMQPTTSKARIVRVQPYA